MVYMHFPHSLTEEEELLQKKYAKLKKKVLYVRYPCDNCKLFHLLHFETEK